MAIVGKTTPCLSRPASNSSSQASDAVCPGGSGGGGKPGRTEQQDIRRGAAGKFQDGKIAADARKAGGTCEEGCSCDYVLVDTSSELAQGGGDEDGKALGGVEVMPVCQGFVWDRLWFSASGDEDVGVGVGVGVRIRRSQAPTADSSWLTPERDDGVHIEGCLSDIPTSMSMPILKLRQREEKPELMGEIKKEIVKLTGSESKESKMVESSTNLIDEGMAKTIGSETCSSCTPNETRAGSSTRSAGEHPIRQPRGPPPIEELRARPTSLFEGSKNFASRAHLAHAGMKSTRAPDTHTKLESDWLNDNHYASAYFGIPDISNQSPRPPQESLPNLPQNLPSNPEPISNRYANLTGNQLPSSRESMTSQIALPSPSTTLPPSPPSPHPSSDWQEHPISVTDSLNKTILQPDNTENEENIEDSEEEKGMSAAVSLLGLGNSMLAALTLMNMRRESGPN
ncbi:hypothetical protein EYC84_003143 [Monilinia fructicola]|uniref:Uncharacterized protein n=1 Tax=Monilinia fructicola TaxID=38448 RepID=A0A5M9JVQ1_MONFR|nr:hypothetical protein EYC84_003143 [Monilinia fructicola]